MKKMLSVQQHLDLIKLGYKDRGPTIGDLIEFLNEEDRYKAELILKWNEEGWHIGNRQGYGWYPNRELIDALFEAVKETLINKTK